MFEFLLFFSSGSDHQSAQNLGHFNSRIEHTQNTINIGPVWKIRERYQSRYPPRSHQYNHDGWRQLRPPPGWAGRVGSGDSPPFLRLRSRSSRLRWQPQVTREASVCHRHSAGHCPQWSPDKQTKCQHDWDGLNSLYSNGARFVWSLYVHSRRMT